MSKIESVTWKKLKESGPELKQIGCFAVRHAKDIESSMWSVGCETMDRDYAVFDNYRDYVGELGVKHGRLQSGWAKTEKEKGVYDFEWLDAHVNGLREMSVAPWMCICYGNPIYGSNLRLGSNLKELTGSAEAMDAWLKYVEALITRYKDTVKAWEIWNEPYSQENQEVYAQLIIPTAEVIRRIQPDSTIMVNPAQTEEAIRLVLDPLKDAGKLELVDRINYHPYYDNPDSFAPKLDALQKLIASYSPHMKMYQGETGCPSILEWGHALAHHPWTEYSKAKWDLRSMAVQHVRNIGYSIFTMVDLQYFNMLQSFGMIRMNLEYKPVYKRPSFYAVQHMVSFFDYTVKPIGELEHNSDSSREITVGGFEKEGSPVLLVWFKDQVPSDDLEWDPVDLTVKNTTFQDPVYVEMITGKVYEIPEANRKTADGNTTFLKLPVWDSPVVIAERAQIDLKDDDSIGKYDCQK